MGTSSVSIVMAACATNQSFFAEAVQSSLSQTHPAHELVIVDDGLSEENRGYLADLKDPRLRIIRNESNMGQSRSVNRAFSQIDSEFIVRMDADDVMLPDRIELEVAFMRAHPSVVAAGALARRTNDGRLIPRRYPDADSLEMGLLFSCDMVHPTMVIRTDAVRNGLRYDEDVLYAQDYMFWCDALSMGDIAQIPAEVLKYRVHQGQISKSKLEDQTRFANVARQRMLSRAGIDLEEGEVGLLSRLVVGGDFLSPNETDFLVDRLLKRARDALSEEDLLLFKRELSFRVFKNGLREISHGNTISAIKSKSFIKAAASCKNWPFYKSSLL